MKTLLSILLILLTASSTAAELVPVRRDGHLGVRIQATSFPESFRRDLTSGLTNRLMIRVTLHQAARELHGRSVEIAIRYDLWEETFSMTTSVDGASVDTVAYREAQQVLQRLEEIKLPALFATSAVPTDSDLVLQAVMLLNPIDRERMDAIKKWVAQNNKRSSLDPAGAMGVGDASLPNVLLERIFEQYASGADVASAWQQALATKPFRLDGLSHESR